MRKLPILLFTAVFALSLALPAYAAESSNEELKAASQYLNSHGIDVYKRQRHNPEFTLMELYQAYTDYHGMMDLTENMYRHVAQEVLGTTTIVYNGVEMDLGKPFERITMVDAVKKYAGVDFSTIHTLSLIHI